MMMIYKHLSLLCFICSSIIQSTLALAASNHHHGSTATTTSSSTKSSSQEDEDWNASIRLLEKARDVRVVLGHESAVPYYKEFLQKHPRIMTAESRIASASSSLKRQDATCPLPSICDESDKNFRNIQKLRCLLKQIGYNNENIEKLFGIKSSTSFGPVYLKPVRTALNEKSFNLPPLMDGPKVLENGTDLDNSSLQCLVAMFILGYAVPRTLLEQNLIGGNDTISLMESLGLAFPCEMDKEIIVPYVHIFPLSIPLLRKNLETGTISDNEVTSMLLVTDLHPTILCRTTVGCAEDGGKFATKLHSITKALLTFPILK